MPLHIKPPYLLRALSPEITWRKTDKKNCVYLTFDDGPLPQATDFVLNTLKSQNIKATFFCVGKNILNNPDLYKKILDEGHVTGNHTHNHLNGWKVRNAEYLRDIIMAEKYISSNLFRPPYGRITPAIIKSISSRYKIIMWDVLSYDFHQMTTPEACVNIVNNNVRSGSIIVFHDSNKARKNLEYTLPRVIDNIKSRGFSFELLS